VGSVGELGRALFEFVVVAAGEEGEDDAEKTKFFTFVCQIMGDDRLVRLFRSSGPLSSNASGTTPTVLPFCRFRFWACCRVLVYFSPHLEFG
jgi:hypothetical protein